MPLFKFLSSLNATITLELTKTNYFLGNIIDGSVTVSSQEDFSCDERSISSIRIERIKGDLHGFAGNFETRIYSPVNDVSGKKPQQLEIAMHRTPVRLLGNTAIANGYRQQFPFKVKIPLHLGLHFRVQDRMVLGCSGYGW